MFCPSNKSAERNRRVGQTLIFEFADFSTKVGRAGDDRPSLIAPSEQIFYWSEDRTLTAHTRSPLFFSSIEGGEHFPFNAPRDEYSRLIRK